MKWPLRRKPPNAPHGEATPSSEPFAAGTLGAITAELQAKGYEGPQAIVVDGITAAGFTRKEPRPRWVESQESHFFGMRVLDAEAFCGSSRLFASGEAGRAVAIQFATSLETVAASLRGRSPVDCVSMPCLLAYPSRGGKPPEGAQFKAAEMEDLWNVFLWDEHLYFTRSWTGTVRYRARAEFRERAIFVGPIEVEGSLGGDPAFAVRQVDFLIKTLLYQERSPAPLQSDTSQDASAAAAAGLVEYGRWGTFPTMEDSTEYGLALNGSRGRFPRSSESIHVMAALHDVASEVDAARRIDLLRGLSLLQVYVPFLFPDGTQRGLAVLSSDQRVEFFMHAHEAGRGLNVYTDRRFRLEPPGGTLQLATSKLWEFIRPKDPHAMIIVDPGGPVTCTLTPDDLRVLADAPNA